MQCFVKKEDRSLIDVENVETAGETNVLPPELTNSIEQFIVYVDRKEAHFTYIYVDIIPTFLRLTTFTKKTPKCHLTYIFCYFYFALGLHP